MEYRQRNLRDLLRMIARSLDPELTGDRMTTVERGNGVRRDVIDAMAIVMDIDDDKITYRDEDFSAAVAKLQINDMESAAIEYVQVRVLERIVRLLVACAKSVSSKRETSRYVTRLPAVPQEAIPTATVIMTAISNDTRSEDTQIELHGAGEVIERELVGSTAHEYAASAKLFSSHRQEMLSCFIRLSCLLASFRVGLSE